VARGDLNVKETMPQIAASGRHVDGAPRSACGDPQLNSALLCRMRIVTFPCRSAAITLQMQ
jgi:hypothetical protein